MSDMTTIAQEIAGRAVLVTVASGSPGSDG